MQETFFVHLEKPRHVFCAAHFITFDGAVCEPIHGHNYRVTVDLEGPLDENHYVIDFIALQTWISAILGELDHHILLPTGHSMIHVDAGENEVEVRFEDRRWVFPRVECALLPMPNTTAELLARYITHRLLDVMAQHGQPPPARLRLAVDESNGQWGGYEVRDTET